MDKQACSGFRFGFATISITPRRPVQLIGQFHERISQRVRDEVTATALALEEGDTGAIVISCDLVCVPKLVQDRVRDALHERLPEFDVTKLFAAATHTHTGPCVPAILEYPDASDGVMPMNEYVDFLVERLAEVAFRAWTDLCAGGVSWVVGHAALGYNRRVRYKDGHTEMYGKTDREDFLCLEGGEDHAVELLYLWDERDVLRGVVINPACPSQVVEGQEYVSADFWAEARRQLRVTYGQDLHVLPLTSAAGDQSPRDMVRRGRGERDMRSDPGLQELGRRIADMVERQYSHARQQIRRDVPVRHVSESVELPLRVPTKAELAAATAESSNLRKQAPQPGTGAWGRLRHIEGALKRQQQYRDGAGFCMELHVLRIGDTVFCTNPFEMFLDFGLQMKARSKALQTFVIQLACDAGGYLPTRRGVEGGSYGAMIWNGDVGPKGGEVLVDRTVCLIEELFA